MKSAQLSLLLLLLTITVTSAFESADPETFEMRLKEAQKILSQVPLIDGQNDLAMSLHDIVNNRLRMFPFNKNLSTVEPWASDTYSHTDLPRLREGMVGAQFWGAWVPCNISGIDYVQEGLGQVDVIKRLIGKYPDDLKFATTSTGISEVFDDGKIASLIGLDGGHMINNSLAILRTYYDAGVRYLTLTHNCNTDWAESCCAENPTDEVHGLTDFGQLVVGEMNRMGMIVDLTHSSEETVRDVLDVTAAPVIFSHVGAKALCDNPGNVPDDILEKMAKNGGIIMVNFASQILTCSENSSIIDVIGHINYIRNITGIDHLGIGSNFNGFVGKTKGLENVSTFPNLFAELLMDDTWTEDDLKKLAGENFLRVFKSVESVKEVLDTESPIETNFSK